MTFIRKKYTEVVEDILNRLTGGIVDEMHTYRAGITDYPLEHTPVKAVISVRGLINGEYHTFLQDTDYKLKDGSVISWIGKFRPDANTNFFVDYFPDGVIPPITDRNVGSVARTLVEAFSREIATLYSQLELTYLNAFIDTATGKSLDFLVAILDIQRIGAGYAEGNVTFSRETPAPADITIPAGTVVTDAKGHAYQTVREMTLRFNQKSISVPVRAMKKGKDQIVEANQLTIMPKPILGIEKVTNEEATLLGLKEETDEELRIRAKTALKATGKATLEAIQFAILSIGGVNSVVLVDMPEGNLGEVDIVLDTESIDSEGYKNYLEKVKRGESLNENDLEIKDFVDKLFQAINSSKAAGIRVNLKFTERVNIKIKLHIEMSESSPSQQEILDLQRQIQEDIKKYLNSLKTGEGIVADKILTILLNNSKIHSVKIEGIDTGGKAQKMWNHDVIVDRFQKISWDKTTDPVEFVSIKGKPAPPAIKKPPAVLPIYIEARIVAKKIDASLEDLKVRTMLDTKARAYFSEMVVGDEIIFNSFLDAIKKPEKYKIITKDDLNEYQNISEATMVRLTHSKDGLMVILEQMGEKDVLRKGEDVEIKTIIINIV